MLSTVDQLLSAGVIVTDFKETVTLLNWRFAKIGKKSRFGLILKPVQNVGLPVFIGFVTQL
jgi:hypothetical protein